MLAHISTYRAVIPPRPQKVVDFETIIKECCEYLQINEIWIVSKSRKREYVRCRHYIMWFGKFHTTMTLKAMGLRLGGRDHSTVIHGHQAIEEQISINNKKIISDIENIKKKFFVN
jgi:chromosomal replication initiator protein